MNEEDCQSCTYNKHENENLNCNRVKCCFLNEKKGKCIIKNLERY